MADTRGGGFVVSRGNLASGISLGKKRASFHAPPPLPPLPPPINNRDNAWIQPLCTEAKAEENGRTRLNSRSSLFLRIFFQKKKKKRFPFAEVFIFLSDDVVSINSGLKIPRWIDIIYEDFDN